MGPIVAGFSLHDYKDVDLDSITNVPSSLEISFDQDSGFGYLKNVTGKWIGTETDPVWYYEDSKVKWTKSFKKSESRKSFIISQRFEFLEKKPTWFFVGIEAKTKSDDPQSADRNLVYFSNQSIETMNVSSGIKREEINSRPDYIGVSTRYFLLAIINRFLGESSMLLLPSSESGGKLMMVFPVSSPTFEIPLEVYFGPKKLDVLRMVEPKLDHTVDFGFFTFIGYWLLKTLNFFYNITKNYGVSIILLTLVLKILTFPLTYKSMKNMKQMQRVQPMIQKLREKYKDNPQQLNLEMMQLMKSQGYNPVAGCLPILIQIPIFFALYKVLYASIELYQAPFMMWIRDLSVKDPVYVTPILLTAVMYLQQKLTPTQTTDPLQAKMIQFMPVIFGIFMISLPSGLTLYMLTNAVAGVFQQIFLNKKLELAPVPIVTSPKAGES
jgi:YidC/Oxa1 family membrane protein insertase